jgi:hypothetical protein
MIIIDEIEELRVDLRHCLLNADASGRDKNSMSCCGPATTPTWLRSPKPQCLYRPATEADAICTGRRRKSTRAAFERVLDLANSDTGQARRAASFILA